MVVRPECVLGHWAAVLGCSKNDLRCQGGRASHLRPRALPQPAVVSEVEQGAARVGLEVPVRARSCNQVGHRLQIRRKAFLVGSTATDVRFGAPHHDDAARVESERHRQH